MFNLENKPGRITTLNAQEYLFFSGYSYLGMGHTPEFIELIKEGIDKFGILFPSSRISNTQIDIYSQFEESLSLITGQEKTVSFSSGYLAGKAVAELFIKGKEAYILENTHPVLKSNNETFKGTTGELVRTINC